MMFIQTEGTAFVRISGVKTVHSPPEDIDNLYEVIESIQENLSQSVFFMLDSGDNLTELTVLENGDTIDISALEYSLESCPTLRICEPLNTSEGMCQTPKIDCSVVVPKKFTIIIDLLYSPVKSKKLCFNEAIETIKIWLNEYIKAIQYYYSVENTILELVPYHFSLKGNITSIFYPLRKRDEDLVTIRRGLHDLLELPMDKPCIRRGNSLFNRGVEKKLVSVHTAVKPPTGDGLVGNVFGNYTYYHYMQDGAQDNGWGCAYRSLQTIISWFKWQGYTRVAIPSHTDIQKALVDMRDKEKKFIGSKQWIGSIEVSNCLRHFCNVESKILSVDKGSDMSSIARALLAHFDKQGTPVMIGGGVLAHTILGIWFDEVSGNAQYLILDPHYTGAEETKTVISKGWCGWKDDKFWNEKAHYNLCLPQRPEGL